MSCRSKKSVRCCINGRKKLFQLRPICKDHREGDIWARSLRTGTGRYGTEERDFWRKELPEQSHRGAEGPGQPGQPPCTLPRPQEQGSPASAGCRTVDERGLLLLLAWAMGHHRLLKLHPKVKFLAAIADRLQLAPPRLALGKSKEHDL